MKTRGDCGFSFVELLVSTAIMLSVVGSMFGLVDAARSVFEIDLERSDMQQRARVSMDALLRDVVMAGAGSQLPAVAPFRRGDSNPDVPGAAFADRLSVKYLPPDAGPPEYVAITYAVRVDGTGVTQLTRYDGHASEVPVVDHIDELRFAYFDAAAQPIPIERFTDGPWVPSAVAADRFDADLQLIRRVRATVRVRPARSFIGLALADLQVTVDISPRNLILQ